MGQTLRDGAFRIEHLMDNAVITINKPDGGKIAEISYSGDIKLYGDVNEAARIFWDAVKGCMTEDMKEGLKENHG